MKNIVAYVGVIITKMTENTATCLECGRRFEQDRDIQLCDKCVDKFDLDKLWRLHDKNQLDALDFNESKAMRERFRIKKTPIKLKDMLARHSSSWIEKETGVWD